MAKGFELSLMVGASVAGALDGLAKVSKSMSQVSESTKKLSEVSKKLNTFDEARGKLNNLNEEYNKSSKALKKLKEEYHKTGNGNKEFAKQVSNAEKYVEKLNNSKAKQILAFNKAKTAIEQEGYNLKNYREKLSKVNKEIEIQNKLKTIQNKHNSRVEKLSKLETFGEKAITRGAVAGAMLTAPIKVYMDLEESQADLRKMLGNEAKKYYKDIEKISKESPLSQPELYEIAGSLAQSGIVGNEIVEYTNKAQKLKVAFDMSTEASGEFLAKTKEQLGLTKEQVFNFADTINYMADNTASSAAQLVEFSNRIGGVARTMNVSKEANIAFGATLISMGKAPEIAAIGIKQLYLELGKGADTKKKQAAFDFLSLDSKNIARDMAKDAEGTIIKVLEKINKLKTEDKAGILNDLFGEQAIDSVATLANNTDKLRENLEKAKSEMAEGAVEKEYANRMDTLTNKLKNLKNRVMSSLANLGLALTPSLNSIIEKLVPLIDKVSQLIEKNPKLTVGIMKAVGVFAMFNLGMGTSLKVFASFFKGFSSLTTMFEKFGTKTGMIKTLSTKFPNIIKKLKSFKDLKKTIPLIFKGGTSQILKMLNPLNVLKLAFNGLKIGVLQSFNVFKLILNPFKALKSAIRIIRAVGIALKVAFMANPVGVIIGAIAILIGIFIILYNKSTWFRKGVNKAINLIIPYVRVLIFIIKSELGRAIKSISDLMQTNAPVMKKIWEGLKPVIKVIGKILVSVVIAAIYLTIGVIKALSSSFRFLVRVAKGVWLVISSVIRTGVGVWKGIFNIFIAFFTGKSNEIPGIVRRTWESVKNGMFGFVNGDKEILGGLFKWFSEQWNNIKNTAGDIFKKLNPLWKHGQNYTGTNSWRGGLTTVAERGAELIKMPGQQAFIAQHEMLMDLPRGTQILNNSETMKALMPKYSNENSLGKGLRNGLSLKDRVEKFKDTISNTNKTNIGGDTISVTINAGNQSNPEEIARLVRREIEKMKNHKYRTEIA